MEKDSKFTRDENGYIAIRTVSAPYSSGSDDKDSMFTRDADGYVAVRTIGGAGGGGGDQHNLGYYATPTALREAHPTAEAGDWAIVGSTDTVWIWDADTEEWVDSDQKGQVTSVNGQTGDVVLDLLPTQTGNAGKFLTTDGTDAGWSDKPLVNTATGTNALTILGTASQPTGGINIGKQSTVINNYDVSIGYNAQTSGQGYGGVSIGYNAKSWNGGIAIGGDSNATNGGHCVIIGASAKNGYSSYGIAIGDKACLSNANHAIQLGSTGAVTTNSDANTFKVANANGNFEIMSADGTIPTARLADTTSATAGQALKLDSNGNAVWENITTSPATAPTLVAANWSSNTQTITVQGVTATNTIIVSPIPTDAEDYAAAGILCTGQATNALTFTCQTTPASDLQVNIVIM